MTSSYTAPPTDSLTLVASCCWHARTLSVLLQTKLRHKSYVQHSHAQMYMHCVNATHTFKEPPCIPYKCCGAFFQRKVARCDSMSSHQCSIVFSAFFSTKAAVLQIAVSTLRLTRMCSNHAADSGKELRLGCTHTCQWVLGGSSMFRALLA